jgi:hypothetical protein
MKGTLRRFDPDERVLSKLVLFGMLMSELFYPAVSWSLVTYDADNNPVAVGATNDTARPFNIYRDVKAVPETRQFPASDVGIDFLGWYCIDNLTAVPIAVLGLHDWDDVDTDIDFTQAEPVSNCRTISAITDDQPGQCVEATTVCVPVRPMGGKHCFGCYGSMGCPGSRSREYGGC